MADDDDSLLGDLISMIPGYGAYRDQESRRADDRKARDFVARRLGDCTSALDRVGAAAVAAGDLETPARLERVRTQLELARTRIVAAVEGYAGWFGERNVDAELLGKVTQLDQNLVSIVDQIDSAIRSPRDAGEPSPAQHVDWTELEAHAQLLLERIDRRNALLEVGS